MRTNFYLRILFSYFRNYTIFKLSLLLVKTWLLFNDHLSLVCWLIKRYLKSSQSKNANCVVTQCKIQILTIRCFSWSICLTTVKHLMHFSFFINLYYMSIYTFVTKGNTLKKNCTAYGCNLLTVSMFGDSRQHIIMLEKSIPCDIN